LSKSIFHTNDFKLNVGGEVKQINLNEGNTQVIFIANSSPESQTLSLSFPSSGKWYDFFSGLSFDVSNKTLPLSLMSGEFHLFVNEAWNTKNLTCRY
jgi:hypothetical protein